MPAAAERPLRFHVHSLRCLEPIPLGRGRTRQGLVCRYEEKIKDRVRNGWDGSARPPRRKTRSLMKLLAQIYWWTPPPGPF